ncbi:MAG: hypothetical protein LBC27_00710 [Spirochaetaceae bacterium]|jgi:histidinol dehydrogenase|nr:hypothetical protein [Spirochaetaceae bacterium]
MAESAEAADSVLRVAGVVVAAETGGTVENHRSREEGLIVYPVYSRRAGGLSIGINLYPDKKYCNFNCAYCEVFPFKNDVSFSIALLESALRKAVANALSRGIPISDICFSGNGEPSISENFAEALRVVSAIRDSMLKDTVSIVIISNGAGLLSENGFDLMQEAVSRYAPVNLWLKLDAGSEDWFRKMDGCAAGFEPLCSAIKEFARHNECVIQTMHCSVNGEPPSAKEMRDWAGLTAEIAKPGNVRLVQIYGKARPSPHDPLCEALPLSSLEERALYLKTAFKNAGVTNTPVAVYE